MDYYGTVGNDNIVGSVNNDYIDGWTGDDSLYGEAGNDYMLGYDGYDYLSGGDGNDVLNGEAGNDYLVGGYGADTFVFNSLYDGVDTIADFYWGEGDTIEVSQFGFGATSTSEFFYDNYNGDLFFQGNLFATIENVPTDFSTELDIALV